MTATIFITIGILLFSGMLVIAGIKMFGYPGGVLWGVLLAAGIVLYVNGKIMP